MSAPVVTNIETRRDDTWAWGERYVDGEFTSKWIQLHTHHPDPERDRRQLEEIARSHDEYRQQVYKIMKEHSVVWWKAVEILNGA